jgi:hypothetical protein
MSSFHLGRRPSRAFVAPLDRPVCSLERTSLEFSDPSTVFSSKPHNEAGCPTLPRFRSQVFSTSQRFLSKLKFHGLVSCRNHSWVLSLQRFPLAKIVCPSQDHWLSCSYSQVCWKAPFEVFLLPVSVTFNPLGSIASFLRQLWVSFPLT